MKIKYGQVMPSSVVRFRQTYKQMTTEAATTISGIVVRGADAEGVVPVRRIPAVSVDALAVIDGMFVDRDGRSTVREDGTPVSPYARELLTEVARVTLGVVQAHGKFLEKVMPDDVQAWFRTAPTLPPPQEKQTPSTRRNGTLVKAGGESIVQEQFQQRPGESDDAYRDRLEKLRIFSPNPLAEYEAAHLWVDPNGYRLSDRIWRTDQETRRNLDAVLITAIREGKSAVEIARLVERWLIPGRAGFRTRTPYGRDGSYDAMRLARTEIARAANQAAYISALRNPYVNRIEVVRSANGDARCPICPMHATIGMGGERLRESYSVYAADIPVYHPHCMCRVEPVVVDDPATVTANLREVMEGARRELLVPVMTPLQIDSFTRSLLGNPVFRLILQNTPLQPSFFGF
ncbi:MAG: hypothetical protein RIC84_08745 [Aggregatilineales bacterium]